MDPSGEEISEVETEEESTLPEEEYELPEEENVLSEQEEQAEEETEGDPLPENMFKKCNLEEIEDPFPDEAFVYLPCQHKFKLRPEDEISVDSIISALIETVAPLEAELCKCTWDIDAKDMLNEKQTMLFEEQLFISRLRNTNCKLQEERKIFLERELEQVGNYCLSIEESYDGYVVLSKSTLSKDNKNLATCGHTLKGSYDNRFRLIAEKRVEYDYVDKARMEKSLEVRNRQDQTLLAIRENKINAESQKFQAVINIKERDEKFLLDGGVMLLMRYMVMNYYKGSFQYYSMNLLGKILRCVLTVRRDRRTVSIFKRTFTNVVTVVNTQYFNETAQEISETYFTNKGKIIIHYWHGFNYLLHETRVPQKPKEIILPKMELLWKKDNMLVKKYCLEKKLNYENAIEYLSQHPEIADFLQDYVIALLTYKPDCVLPFTIMFFQNMKSNWGNKSKK